MKQLLLLFTLVTTGIMAYTENDNAKQIQEYLRIAHEHKARNEIDSALRFYQHAIDLDQTNFNLVFEVANFLFSQGYIERALTYYDHAAELNPHAEQIYFNKGVAYNQLNQHEKAAECFLQAINTNNLYERAHLHAVSSFRSCQKIDQGIEVAKRSVKIISNNAELHYRYGLLLKDKELYTKALKQFSKAVSINPTHKQYLLELGNALYRLDEYQEALYVFERLLELNPSDTHVLYNFGVTLNALGFVEHAIKVYDRVIELHPDFVPVQFGRALAYLTCGDFERGLPGYEWRWKLGNIHKRHTAITEWTGKEDLTGKTLLIIAEQGLGDTIQFIRYAEVAHTMGARIIVESQPAVKDILKLCPYIDTVYAYGEKLPHADYRISLMSMPLALHTTVETVPQNVPYLHADQALVSYWKEKLKDDTTLKIGICWQGNRNYTSPELRHNVATKSLHPAQLAPLARIKGVTLYNLQKGIEPDQLKELPADMVIKEFDEPIDTEHGRFMDTVALMAEVLDLIITIDTSTCHVAGALGVPVWTLLPHHADWRWMRNRTDTPWYSTMRLFRQPTDQDWQSVIQACCDELQEIIHGTKTITEVTQEKGYAPEPMPTLSTGRSNFLPCMQNARNITSAHIEPAYAIEQHIQMNVPMNIKGAVAFEPLGSKTLKETAHELIMISTELESLQQKLKALPELSPFDADTVELFRACVKAYDHACDVKNQLVQR